MSESDSDDDPEEEDEEDEDGFLASLVVLEAFEEDELESDDAVKR